MGHRGVLNLCDFSSSNSLYFCLLFELNNIFLAMQYMFFFVFTMSVYNSSEPTIETNAFEY